MLRNLKIILQNLAISMAMLEIRTQITLSCNASFTHTYTNGFNTKEAELCVCVWAHLNIFTSNRDNSDANLPKDSYPYGSGYVIEKHSMEMLI